MTRTWMTGCLLALIAAACSADRPVQPGAAATGPSFSGGTVEKFTFAGVTLVDGEAVFENALIEAGSRDKAGTKQDFTNCSYFTEAYREYLGQVASADFASHDPGAVRQFCEQSFPNRQ